MRMSVTWGVRAALLVCALAANSQMTRAAELAARPLVPALGPLPETRVNREDAVEHYGVPQGRCNRLVVGAVLGGTIAAGERIGGGGERATPVGRLEGRLLGGDGRIEVETPERGCAQQALEFGADGVAVTWRHGATRFSLTPRAANGATEKRCRAFEFVARGGPPTGTVRGRACRVDALTWEARD
ncbi:MAG: hypothetical protein AB7I01_16885 [Gammaproteobacteria bacterium]